MGKKEEGDPVETMADLICPHCESSIEKFDMVQREFTRRGPFNSKIYTAAIACPSCRRLLGFYNV